MTDFQRTIIAAAESGALVLTANKRLARHLVAAFDQQMQAGGESVWQTPQIISFDGWLHRNLADLGESWRLLEGISALRLWEQLLEKESAGSELELLQLAATARKVQEAHQCSVAYDCQLADYPLTEDQRVFRCWQDAYLRECEEHHWLDRAELPKRIYAAMSEGRLALPADVLIVGFDQWSPELEGLRQVVEQAGGKLVELNASVDPHATIGRYPCPDPQQEVVLAARWARGLLEQGATSVGVVVPDLQARRKEIERVFRQQIDPAADLQLQDEDAAFSLSLGAPLLEQGPVHAALEILGAGYRLSIEQASYLLRTPYLGGSQSEADKRALLDSRLRSFRQQRIGLKKLLEQAAQENRADQAARIFSTLIKGLEGRERLLPGAWAGRFSQQLQAVGWPGERSLASSEYQMVKAWQEKLLPGFASLDSVSPPLDRGQALGLLRRLAGETEFQLEAATGPVQVVGLLESAGLVFEHLWVMGLNEERFPAATRPNPFLPIGLQVEKGMPHASAERELLFARNVLQRLKAASCNIIISYPQRSGDCDLRPSPLIRDLPESDPDFSVRQDALTQQASMAPGLLELHDIQGPALAAERGEGGTAILKDQALCPFRAFAHFRLRGKDFDPAQPGLDPMTRGNLLHKVLELFWGRVRSQDQLLALTGSRRSDLIAEQVERALMDYFSEQGKPPRKLLEIEANRLQALVNEWLSEIEEQRSPFTVAEMEQEHFEQIGPLKIRTFVDRIDQLEDGSRVILDYKTGLVKVDNLLAERLLEPQLPIYAIASDQQPADGVAFAQVRRGDCRLIGVAREDGLLPKVPGVAGSKPAQKLGLSGWPQVIEYWREQLVQLAGDFVAGKATVDPVDVEIACRFCDLAGLCRISEAQLGTASEETQS